MKPIFHSNSRLWVAILLMVCIGSCLATPEVWASEDGANTPAGRTGIVLKTQEGEAIVVGVLPFSPAATNDNVQIGDKILSVSRSGNENDFVSTKGMSVQDVASLLAGNPGSLVVLRVLRPFGGTEETITLQRAQPVRFHLPTGEVGVGFASSSLEPKLKITEEDVKSLRHIGSELWSRVTVGMPGDSVLGQIGHPLATGGGHFPGELAWYYGWIVYTNGVAMKPMTGVIFLTNGVVSEPFGFNQAPEWRIEVLSK